jgi:hypothetical protein
MKEPSLMETKRFLEKTREDWRRGWTNLIGRDKGKVTEPMARNAIACLTVAIRNIPWRKPKKKK